MKKLEKPYRGPNVIFPQYYRDSRHMFGGVRFQEEKRNRDWMWAVASVIVGIIALIVMAGRL